MSDHIHPIYDRMLERADRERLLGQRGHVYWLTGLSGSGKSTVALATEKLLYAQGHPAQLLDGDNIRSGICSDLSFTDVDRAENIRRIAEVAKLFKEAGLIVLCSFISPRAEMRTQAAQIIGADDYSEIYIEASLEICEDRDVKGLYKKARAGEIKNFTGIDSEYDVPASPHLILNTSEQSVDASAEYLLKYIQKVSIQ